MSKGARVKKYVCVKASVCKSFCVQKHLRKQRLFERFCMSKLCLYRLLCVKASVCESICVCVCASAFVSKLLRVKGAICKSFMCTGFSVSMLLCRKVAPRETAFVCQSCFA